MIVALSTFSCKKETNFNQDEASLESTYNKNLGYSVSNGMLTIASLDQYDSLIRSSEDENFNRTLIGLNYLSYAETVTVDSLNEIEDSFLSAALNKDLCIQIQNYIYRINKREKAVYALHKDHFALYNDLVAQNISNPRVLKFSTEDEVFELLGEDKDEDAEKAKDCQTSNQNNNGGWFQYADFVDAGNKFGNGTTKRYKFKVWLRVRYDNWGIYKKLFMEFKHREKGGGLSPGLEMAYASFGYQVKYKSKSGESGSYNVSPSYNFATDPNITGYNYYDFQVRDKEFVFYRGKKCLKNYVIRGWVWFRDKETNKPRLYPNNGCLRIEGGDLYDNEYTC